MPPHRADRVLAEVFPLLAKALSVLRGVGGVSPQVPVATRPATRDNVARSCVSCVC